MTRQVIGPTDLPPKLWWSAFGRSIRRTRNDHLSDQAAALTYYGTLALFPALIVLVALLGLLGSYPRTTNSLLDIVDQLGPRSAVDTFRGPIEGVVRHKGGAGALLALGLVMALWSASGYVGAFMRASNVVYETEEDRRFWKLRPLQIVVTIVMVVTISIVGLSIVVTGPIAEAVGDAVGVGSTAVSVWNLAKWPVLVGIVTTMIAFLYYVAPNVSQRFRWVTPGSFIAVVVWFVASLGFGLYVRFVGSYNQTYGTLAGVVIFLVWLWVTNLAILFGAAFNAELERARERTIPAHEAIPAEAVGLGARGEQRESASTRGGSL